ncbi:MAG: helix-turn-helix transcriptional regulator [Alphaproteobacteria bacterium]|nr:helix-turn-helix transcriptional regulator [Alphaproteobacteria bacterium]
MALFFDSQWFDARLAALGLSRAELGRALGLSDGQLAEVFKDQRELSADDVRLIAALLGVEAKEVASRAGVSTPMPREIVAREEGPHDGHRGDGPHEDGLPEDGPAEDGLSSASLERRLSRLEAEVAEIKSMLKPR